MQAAADIFSREAAQTGTELGALAQSLGEAGDIFAQAEARIRKREDLIAVTKAEAAYDQGMRERFNAISTEQDWALIKTGTEYRDFSSQSRQNALTGFSGSVDARAAFEASLYKRHNSWMGKAAAETLGAQNAFFLGQIEEGAADLQRRAFENPSAALSLLVEADALVDKHAPGLKPEQERFTRADTYSRIITGAVDRLIAQGEIDDAEEIVLDPAVRGVLGTESQGDLFRRLTNARIEIANRGLTGAAAGAATIEEATAILGREPGPGERIQLAGFEEVVPVRPDVLDETGAIKRDASAEIRRQAVQLLGGSETTALPADVARAAQELGAETEKILEAGEEDSIGQAVALATKRVDLPEALSFPEIADRGIAAIEQETAEGPTEAELASAEQKLRVQDATGAVSAFIDFFGNRIVGQIDPSYVDPDIVTARQRLALLETEFVVAFRRSPRLPVWEQVKLSRIFQGPAILRSPEAVRVELQTIEQLLTDHIEINRRLLEAPLPIEMKSEALGEIMSLAGFRARIRNFELNPAFPEFRTVEDVGAGSIEELRAFVERTPEEELNLLPPEVVDLMADRLTKGQ
ncbi:MAG TPA: hypothetical protein ENH55_13185 [Aurantimonas coralicida]|uniref:Uncharacterized protein n=1 Tax=Aurantimonas coralicida TaxID=182270 RepID=A0A9C9TG04_9HYPH|nr:hypothetical protein [Aurantimonas coralicida]HET99613.1 hypothetical protein [Aurantimonas coralicida]